MFKYSLTLSHRVTPELTDNEKKHIESGKCAVGASRDKNIRKTRLRLLHIRQAKVGEIKLGWPMMGRKAHCLKNSKRPFGE